MPMTSQYWAVGTAGLFFHHRRAVLEGSALSLNWAYLKSLFFPLQIKYLWQEIRLDIPETSKGLGTHCPAFARHVTQSTFEGRLFTFNLSPWRNANTHLEPGLW